MTEYVLSGQEFHTLKTYAYEKPGRYEGREPPQHKQRRDSNLRTFADDHNIEHDEVRSLIDDLHRAKRGPHGGNSEIRGILEDLLPYAAPSADAEPPYDY